MSKKLSEDESKQRAERILAKIAAGSGQEIAQEETGRTELDKVMEGLKEDEELYLCENDDYESIDGAAVAGKKSKL